MKFFYVGLFLYVGACFGWVWYALNKFMQMRDAFNATDPEVVRKNRQFERPDFKRISRERMLLSAIFLFPLRIGIFSLFLLHYTIIAKILVICFKPGSKAGQRIFEALEFFHGKLGLLLLGILRIKHHGSPLAASETRIPRSYISNHISPADILFYMTTVHPSFVAKASVRTDILVGALAREMECVFVDRDSAEDRGIASKAITDRQTLITAKAARRSLVVFPEGTTSNGRYILPFKKGAFEGNGVLQPVVLVYDCPEFDVSFEIIPITWWLPLILASSSIITLHVYWLEEIKCGESSDVATDLARERMSQVIYNHHKDAWEYNRGEKVPLDWGGGYRTKVELFKQLLKKMNLDGSKFL